MNICIMNMTLTEKFVIWSSFALIRSEMLLYRIDCMLTWSILI